MKKKIVKSIALSVILIASVIYIVSQCVVFVPAGSISPSSLPEKIEKQLNK